MSQVIVSKQARPLKNWFNHFSTEDVCYGWANPSKENGLSAAGTLTEQENVPLAVKEANLTQGEHIGQHSQYW